MSDPSAKTVTTLAIAEKRPQRPGGCVGIFFQLFDWNRRLAKKKLFSKKLLSPARAKRLLKKFDGDEKLPATKLLLIADENCGGFPNAKSAGIDHLCSSNDSERNNGMKTPGLVARLMGLESMPVVRRNKPKKPSVPEFYSDGEKKPTKQVDNHVKAPELYYYDQDSSSEKGQAKGDSRPQKLQKTGLFDRRPITKFGAEALQFKSILSRSRKHHHHKLASPVKSPRILSGRNAARLMEAATKILEPGLQATNRAKCSLTYSVSHGLSMEDRASVKGTEVLYSKQSTPCSYPFGSNSLKMQSSCNSCGNLVDVVEFRPRVEDRDLHFASSASDFSNTSCESGKSKVELSQLCSKQERDPDSGRSVFVQSQERAVSLAAQPKVNVRRRTQNIMDRKPPYIREDRGHRMPSLHCNSQRPIPLNAHRHNNQMQNQMLVVKDKIPQKAQPCTRQIRSDVAADAHNRAKDYVALNKNLSNLATRTRLPTKVTDNYRMDMERNTCNKKDDSLLRVKPLARKRRPVTSNPMVENTGSINSSFGMQRTGRSDVGMQQSGRSDVGDGNGVVFNACTMSQGSVKTGSRKVTDGNGSSSSKNADVISFAFRSPMRHNSGPLSSVEMDKRKGRGHRCNTSHQSNVMCSTSNQINIMSEAKDGKLSSLRDSEIKRDALGALLEKKLRELTCSGRDELETGNSLAGRSTASILQELISALNMVGPMSEGNVDNCSVGSCSKDGLCDGSPDHDVGQAFYMNRKLKTETDAAVSTKFQRASDCEHPSPTSILEASFSNESCFSGSLDGSSEHKLYQTSTGCSHDRIQPNYPDFELSDSATSMDAAKTEKIADSVNKIARAHSIDPAEIGLTGGQLSYAREVISYAELLFENLAIYDVDGMGDSIIESLATDLWKSLEYDGELVEVKEGGLLKRFIFDCMIECLDLSYSQYRNLSYRVWSTLPLFLGRDRLVKQVCQEIGRWRCLGRKILDDIVEREMSYSAQKWVDFGVEAFEAGREIEGDILQILLDEVVLDLWQ